MFPRIEHYQRPPLPPAPASRQSTRHAAPARYPERLAEQAAAFRIPAGEVIGWGEKAKAFTEKFLARPFTVHTQKVDARGSSKKNTTPSYRLRRPATSPKRSSGQASPEPSASSR